MQVFLHHTAHKYLDRLNKTDRERIKAALKDLEKEPFLSLLVEPLYTIEPASKAECAKVERRVREYHKNPQSFVPLKDIR